MPQSSKSYDESIIKAGESIDLNIQFYDVDSFEIIASFFGEIIYGLNRVYGVKNHENQSIFSVEKPDENMYESL